MASTNGAVPPGNGFHFDSGNVDDSGDGRAFYEEGSVWTPDGARKSELITAVRGIENKSTGGFTKFIVLLVSLAVFVAAGVAWWDPWVVSMLVVVLLFHEAGHYIAMRMFGYRNVKMFFIPFLGAAVSGRHFNISGWKKALVYLAGPVPGILVSLPVMAGGLAWEKDWMLELGGMGLLLNTLNLLPIMPLDGGWIMHLTVFSRSPILELVARLIGIAAMIAFSVFTGSRFILFIAIPLILSLPTTFRVAKLIRRLRDRPLPQPERDEIPDAAVRLLDDEMQTTPLATTPTANKAALIVQMYESLIVRPPGVLATIGIWCLYGGAFVVAIGGGMGILVARDVFRSDVFDLDMFDADPHVVPLDADDTRFHLGTAPVDDSYLAVTRFDSVRELDESTQRLHAGDLERYTHVRFGNVWFATIPKEKTNDADVVEEAERDADDEFDAESEDAQWDDFDEFAEVRERMRDLLRPIDPAETWIASLTRGTSDSADGDGDSPLPGQPIVHVISGMQHGTVQIRAMASDLETAEAVAAEYFQMPGVTGDRLYLPKWSPMDPPTPTQIECRNVLKTLISGITKKSAPDLHTELVQARKEMYAANREDDYDPVEAAEYAEKTRQLQMRFTEDVIATLEGDPATLARMYQRYQRDYLDHQKTLEEHAIKVRAMDQAGLDTDEAYEEIEDLEYPVMDGYLENDGNLLGYSDPTKRSHHFACHVSGEVMTGDAVMEMLDEQRVEDGGTVEDGDTQQWAADDVFLDLFVHRATDQAAVLSAIVAFLDERGFHSFELHYATPTAEFD
ncbi:MAG: site-2 protease family protein [Rhodopirellula sp. JB044]|uniref:site-2 protease family protein n=1 Tax=Rhodopirellula sp. JB044 TaxID=3342844 RepID=UPI00370C1B99